MEDLSWDCFKGGRLLQYVQGLVDARFNQSSFGMGWDDLCLSDQLSDLSIFCTMRYNI